MKHNNHQNFPPEKNKKKQKKKKKKKKKTQQTRISNKPSQRATANERKIQEPRCALYEARPSTANSVNKSQKKNKKKKRKKKKKTFIFQGDEPLGVL
jgi:hypothetical protein